MNEEELYEEWTSGEETGLRPARIQRLRDDIRRHTGLPVPRRIPEIESWLPRFKGQVTKKLRAKVEDGEDGEGEGDA